jgi:two-component system, LytTR family, sensor kinase
MSYWNRLFNIFQSNHNFSKHLMLINTLIKSKLLRHLVYWLIPYTVLLILEATAPDASTYNGFTQVTVSFATAAAIIYSSIYLCKKYFFSNKAVYFLGVSILYSLYLLLIYFLIIVPENEKPVPVKATTTFNIIYFTLYFIVLALIGFVYWAVITTNKKNKELQSTQLQLQEFKHDKLNAENKFLQSQINPHFLYNTLNYFYAQSLTVSPQLADSILLLSDIMRYSLELKENEQGMTPLSEEITHINNIIKINQYRFNNKLQIQFLLTGQTAGVCIAPLVLITFVENAFKHAELSDLQNPLIIMLNISAADQTIYFSVHNKKKKGPKEMGNGIGLDNAERRLKFLYHNNYTLAIKNEADLYTASLSLPLFKDVTL